MSHFIEGIGDEIIWILFIVLAIFVVYVAWKSTGISPTEYYVWLVRMRVNSNLNTFQILRMADTDAHLFEQRLAQRSQTNANAVSYSEVPERDGLEANENTQSRTRSLPGFDSGLSFTENVRHWEVELVPQAETFGNTSAVSNPNESLTDTLRRRSSSANVMGSADNRHTTRLLLSRLPVRIDNNQEAEIDSILDTDESFSSIHSMTREQNEAAPSQRVSQSSASTDSSHAPTLNSSQISNAAGSTLLENSCKKNTRIKLKFLDDTQIVATTSLETTVGEFKSQYFYDPILAGKVVRLIYRGQLLRDDSRSLSSYGIHDECVLHCNVSSVPYAHPSNTSNSTSRQGSQTYHGEVIEDNPTDPYLLRFRNALIRWLRSSYNVVMGPAPRFEEERRDEVAAAAAAASRRFNDRTEAVSIGMLFGQHLHIFFAVKFLLLWTFVCLYPQYTDTLSIVILSFLTVFFATIMFTSHRESRAVA